jgi:hypothetical protein
MIAAAVATHLRLQALAGSYARGVLVSKSLTLPKGVHDGFLPVNKKKGPSKIDWGECGLILSALHILK